jgi:hypothetical protein
VRIWFQIAVLCAGALVLVLLLGPLIGVVEQSILGCLVLAGSVVLVLRDRRRRSAGT